MKAWLQCTLAGLVALGGLASAVPRAAAETATLELKRLEASRREGLVLDGSGDFLLRMIYPQHFFMQMGENLPKEVTEHEKTQFDRVVKKQPEKYHAKHPFYGVAKLGSEEYAFVVDTADDKSKGFDRFYFDVNHNGDLTDDEVIKAAPSLSMGRNDYYRAQFPRVDLTVNADGKKVEYAFFFSLYSHTSDDYSYVSASLNAAAYREGRIKLDGREQRVLLVDFNSNGRFDDEMAVRDDVQTSDGRLHPKYGDILMVDPDIKTLNRRISYEVTPGTGRHYVSKLIAVNDCFYNMKITPAGDKLTLTPSTTPLGQVTNPNAKFSAIVYSDQGFVQICGGKDKPCDLPEGEWKLLNYTIDVPKADEAKADEKKAKPAEEEEAKLDGKKTEKADGKEKKTSLLSTLAKALLGSSSPPTPTVVARDESSYVSAQATRDYKPVKVTAGKTVVLPFGPPYKPVVKIAYFQPNKKQAELELLLVGSVGEVCSDMVVKGSRPGSPEFSIKTRDGKVEAEGAFKYG